MLTAKQLAEATQVVKEKNGDVVVDMSLLCDIFKQAESIEDEPRRFTIEEIRNWIKSLPWHNKESLLKYYIEEQYISRANQLPPKGDIQSNQPQYDNSLQGNYLQYVEKCILKGVIARAFNEWHKAVNQRPERSEQEQYLDYVQICIGKIIVPNTFEAWKELI